MMIDDCSYDIMYVFISILVKYSMNTEPIKLSFEFLSFFIGHFQFLSSIITGINNFILVLRNRLESEHIL